MIITEIYDSYINWIKMMQIVILMFFFPQIKCEVVKKKFTYVLKTTKAKTCIKLNFLVKTLEI